MVYTTIDEEQSIAYGELAKKMFEHKIDETKIRYGFSMENMEEEQGIFYAGLAKKLVR